MFRYNFNQKSYCHNIIVDQKISTSAQKLLGEILLSFPHASNSTWPTSFASLKLENIPKELLSIAANAYDSYGNTVLGVACEYGYSEEAVQRLIDLGANLDTADRNMGKLALHWAICNKVTCDKKKKSEDPYAAVRIVKLPLDNGARTDLTCYENTTPFEYARSRGYTAAANLIKSKYTRGATYGLLQDKLPYDLCENTSSFFSAKDAARIAQTCKAAHHFSKTEDDTKPSPQR